MQFWHIKLRIPLILTAVRSFFSWFWHTKNLKLLFLYAGNFDGKSFVCKLFYILQKLYLSILLNHLLLWIAVLGVWFRNEIWYNIVRYYTGPERSVVAMNKLRDSMCEAHAIIKKMHNFRWTQNGQISQTFFLNGKITDIKKILLIKL